MNANSLSSRGNSRLGPDSRDRARCGARRHRRVPLHHQPPLRRFPQRHGCEDREAAPPATTRRACPRRLVARCKVTGELAVSFPRITAGSALSNSRCTRRTRVLPTSPSVPRRPAPNFLRHAPASKVPRRLIRCSRAFAGERDGRYTAPCDPLLPFLSCPQSRSWLAWAPSCSRAVRVTMGLAPTWVTSARAETNRFPMESRSALPQRTAAHAAQTVARVPRRSSS